MSTLIVNQLRLETSNRSERGEMWQKAHYDIKQNAHCKMRQNTHCEARQNAHCEMGINSHCLVGNKPSSVTRDKTTAVQVRQNAHCEVGEYPQCGRAKRPLWGGATGSKRALCSRGPKNPTVTRIETSAVKWGKTPSVRWRKTPIMRRRETPVVRRAKKVNPKITKISLALQHVTSNAFLGFCFFFPKDVAVCKKHGAT